MKSHNRPSTSLVALIIAVGLHLGAAPGGVEAAGRPEWLGKAEYADSGSVTVVVFLENESLAGDVRSTAAPMMTRESRIKAVTARLKSHRSSGDNAVEEFLHQRATGQVERFWIVPAFKATLSIKDVETLAALPGVSGVVPDLPVDMIEPVDMKASTASAATSSAHLQLMNVPALWARGITGVGRLVCSFDTGVQGSHPALANNWRGIHSSLASSWFSTISPTSLPSDKVGHGSHTMGTMVGIEGTDTIGVAPGAEWIAAGVVDQGKSLSATFADILAAFQWALDPDGDPSTTNDVPDVILNSWGVPGSLFSPCDQTFFAAIDNVEAAGIVCIFSAGNEGPSPSSLRNPASRATSPLNAFSVGAVDNSKVIAGFSSRGPGGCGFTEIKPEIVAPGINVRSVNKDGGYKLMSGTSMAAPFIAGLVALCRQYNPNATVDEIKWAIINSCEDLGDVGEDNTYGYGLPDASVILDYLSTSERPHFRLAGYSISGDGVALPGETFDLRVTLARTTGVIESVNGLMSAPASENVTVDNDTVRFFFGELGTTAIGFESFGLHFDPSLIHGDSASVILRVADEAGQVLDTLTITLPIGYAEISTVARPS
jgi:subtilisin family serine protease